MEKLHNFKLIAFDLDGTLINTVPDLNLSLNLALTEYGFAKVTESQVKSWVGNGMKTLVQRAIDEVINKADQNPFVEIFNSFQSHYANNNCNLSQLYPNVIDTLQKLHQQQIPLAIITNKASCYIKPILQHFNLINYFSDLIGDGDLAKLKPHPTSIYYLCGKYGLYPKEILFIGDSNNDVLLAKNSGCDVVGLTYGYNYNESILKYDPDWVTDNIADILTII